MKANDKLKFQRGFFDFGIALIILAFSGTMAYTTKDKGQQEPVQVTEEQSSQIVMLQEDRKAQIINRNENRLGR